MPCGRGRRRVAMKPHAVRIEKNRVIAQAATPRPLPTKRERKGMRRYLDTATNDGGNRTANLTTLHRNFTINSVREGRGEVSRGYPTQALTINMR